MINLFDLDEEHDPALSHIPGSNQDGASWDRQDIENCAAALGVVAL